jgi:peroxiredoxin
MTMALGLRPVNPFQWIIKDILPCRPPRTKSHHRQAKSGGTSGVKIELPNCINATARAVQLIDRKNTFDLVFVLGKQRNHKVYGF